MNYIIPAGGSWTCINSKSEPDCVTHYVPYPASVGEDFYFVSDWDVTIKVRVIKTASNICLVGIFDSHQGKTEEVQLGARGYTLNSCMVVEKKPCEVEGFVFCVASKFSKKFPFDILTNLPSSEITCPKFTINLISQSRTFDLCWVYEAMRPLKYAVAMSLLIKLFIYS